MGRKETYEKRKKELVKKCLECRKKSTPSWDQCNYYCTIGIRLRMLEAEYSDITGWSHKNWSIK